MKNAYEEKITEFKNSVEALVGEGKVDEARKVAGRLPYPERKVVRELFQQFKPENPRCPDCGGDPQEIFFTEYNFEWVVLPCAECKSKRMQTEIAEVKKRLLADVVKILAARGVPRRYLNARLTDFSAACAGIAKDGTGAFLSGPRGTGKTHLAVAILRDVLERSIEREVTEKIVGHLRSFPNDFRFPGIRFVSVPDLLLEIRDTFRAGSAAREADVMERYADVPLLVFDDLGSEKSTEWSLQTLYTLVNRRYVGMLQTIITSNLSMQEVAEKVGDRIASRVVEMCEIHIMAGRDRRLDKASGR